MKQAILPIFVLAGTISSGALDLSLKECVDMALASDENMKIAENNVRGSALDREVARTQYLPNFSGSATAVYSAPDSKIGDMMTMQMRGAYMAGISLTQPVYTGGKITAANRIARSAEEISGQQLRATAMDVRAEAEKSYWTYVAVLSKVDMTRSYLDMIDSIHNVTASSVELGMAAPQVLLRVKTRQSELIYRLRQAEAGADVCRMALCRTIGVADTVAIRPVEPLDGPMAMPAADLSVDNRPETMMLAQNIDIRKHQVSLARADFLPTVGVQLGWSAYGNLKMKGWTQDQAGNPTAFSSTTSSNGFMGLLSVQVPIFHWGEGIKKVRKAKLEVENARLSFEHNRRLMELEVRQNYSNLLTGVDLVRSAETAMGEADENLRLMKEQYEVGLLTLTDLLEAQTQWQTSYSNLIEARTQWHIYRVDYLRSAGLLE